MAHSSPLTGEYLRAFERHATKSDPECGATVPCWEIVAYAADILDIAARELGDSLDMCRLARSLGIGGVVLNKYVDMLKPSEKGIILIGANDGEAIVVLRETLCRAEKRFTLAHEIGHYCLHVRSSRGGLLHMEQRRHRAGGGNIRGGAHVSAGSEGSTESGTRRITKGGEHNAVNISKRPRTADNISGNCDTTVLRANRAFQQRHQGTFREARAPRPSRA